MMLFRNKYVLHFLLLSTTLLLGACASQKDKQALDFTIESNPEHWIELAAQQREMGENQVAKNQYEKVLEVYPNNIPALQGLAQTQADLHENQQALETWNKLLTLSPTDSKAILGKSKIYIHQGQLDEARKLLEAGVQKQGEQWQLWDTLGIVSDLQKDYLSATQCYEKALILAPTEANIYNNYGYSRIMAHDYQGAVDILKKGIQQQSTSEHLKNNLAIAYAWMGEYRKARKLFRTIVGHPQAYNNVGYIAMLKKDYAIAEEHFKTAIDISPSFYHRANENLLKLEELRKQERESSTLQN